MHLNKSPQIRYSEIFYSLQGEGRFVGAPSVFLRTFGCNFRCHGFGQVGDPKDWIAPSQMPYLRGPSPGVRQLAEVEVPPIGCDSAPSWAPPYRHLAKTEPVERIAELLVQATPSISGRPLILPSGQDVHLVVTGGEPLLGWQEAYPALLIQEPLRNLQNLTFETNGTKELLPVLNAALGDAGTRGVHINWSVSPKLSLSGESWDQAIRPEVLLGYTKVPGSYLYLKFVVGSRDDFVEIGRAVTAYQEAGVPIGAIYAMPVGGTQSDYEGRRCHIAELCMEYGYRFSPRLHVDLFGNRFGT